MESYQQQLKEQQGKLQKASKQAQEAAAKAVAQQQVSFAVLPQTEDAKVTACWPVPPCFHAVPAPASIQPTGLLIARTCLTWTSCVQALQEQMI